MKLEDLSYMRKGTHLKDLTLEDVKYLKPQASNNLSGKVLILIHGFGATPAVFRKIMPALTSFATVYCPVLPGHADSIASFAKASANDWLEYLRIFIKKIAAKHQDIEVLGLSLGGLLATHLSFEFKFKKLFLVAPAFSLHMPRHLKVLLNFLAFLGVREIRNLAGDIKASDMSDIAYKRLPLAAIREIINFTEAYNWQDFVCPTQIFLGAHDKVVDNTVIINSLTEHKNLKITICENSAHLITLDNDYQIIIDALVSRLQPHI